VLPENRQKGFAPGHITAGAYIGHSRLAVLWVLSSCTTVHTAYLINALCLKSYADSGVEACMEA